MLPDPAPVPIAAVAYIPGFRVDVTFDRPLVAGAVTPTTWFVRHGGLDYGIFTSASSGAGVVIGLSGGTKSDPGPDVVSYSPPPFDIKSLVGGVPAAAFTGFPLV